ncbi:hypothetical protein K505DRAFT_43730 [Melanomma pulvis-pyrius CBS 109.77]|uniref:Uncharacterized protein n=1 Tax=Melanomma pulvis-pyrius CBS 109.77 TaxID=1314802 RepID=A0A6A6XZT2_9PLEO|nr:hypothetical protein K505DRAFT_43730 [Melanomma pulvis-pyrius CBS 109.77]
MQPVPRPTIPSHRGTYMQSAAPSIGPSAPVPICISACSCRYLSPYLHPSLDPLSILPVQTHPYRPKKNPPSDVHNTPIPAPNTHAYNHLYATPPSHPRAPRTSLMHPSHDPPRAPLPAALHTAVCREKFRIEDLRRILEMGVGRAVLEPVWERGDLVRINAWACGCSCRQRGDVFAGDMLRWDGTGWDGMGRDGGW